MQTIDETLAIVRDAQKWFRKIRDEVNADYSRWTKGLYARTQSGRSCMPTSEKAVCWCVIGFMERDRSEIGHKVYSQVYEFLTEPYLCSSASSKNDRLRSAKQFVTWMEEMELAAERRIQSFSLEKGDSNG